jgi:signal transduction histidine kinase
VEIAGRSLTTPGHLAVQSVWIAGSTVKGGGPAKTYLAPFADAGHEGIAPTVLATSRKTERIYFGTNELVIIDPPPVLAAGRKSEQGMDLLNLKIYLTSPATLFARQRDRTLWFALLIVVSAATAVTGLVVAWRAFDRQQWLNEMKSNFVSSVSHELRAPIASVRLMAESLDRGKISDSHKQAGYFKLIVQECRRLTSLIENVLDFSKIEQGGRRYEFEPTDLAVLIQQTLTLMEPYATARKVSLHFELPNDPMIIDTDGKAIQQALINLLDNAIKHSPDGSVVDCGFEAPLDTITARMRIFVRDRGDGIPAGERSRIFEPFYRCGSELRRETQGVGIGLTIVKHIVEAHGGRVEVQSEPGKGSCFVMDLPLSRVADDQNGSRN